MIAAQATHIARPVRPFITNEGTHTPAQWAELTCAMLISRGHGIPQDRLDAAKTLRARMIGTLREAFEAVKPTTAGVTIENIARGVVRRFGEFAQGTPWAQDFAHPGVIDAMNELVRRNLVTHAELQLRME